MWFLLSLLFGGFTPGAAAGGYATIQDEGTPRTQRTTVNFAGAGVSCVDSGGITVCTIAGGAGAGFTNYDVDFGTTAKRAVTATVTDAAVNATSKILIQQVGIAPAGRQADEAEMDSLLCRAIPGTGTFKLICTSLEGATHGLARVAYQVN